MVAEAVSRRAGWRLHLGVFAAYVALAVAMTWPVASRLRTVVPNDLIDPLLNTWLLWWNSQHVPLSVGWWQAPNFFPAPDALTFSEHLAGLSPLASPIVWASGDPLLAYNVVFLLSFPLSAFAAYLLGLELTGRADAAFLGGLLYGFAPYRVAQLAHLQVLASYAMPLALLGLHRYVRGGGLAWLGLFGIAWLAQALTNGYYLAYFTVLVGLWVLWFVRWREWRTAASIALTGAVAAVPVLLIVAGYRASHARYDFHRVMDEIRAFSADVLSPVTASYRLSLWDWLRFGPKPEGELFPGLGVVLLILVGVWAGRSSWRRVAPVAPRTRRWLISLAAIFGVVAVTAMATPWTLTLAGQTISASRPDKPLTSALVLLAIVAALSRPLRSAWRTRSPFAFYLIAALFCWLAALGPEPRLGDLQVLYEPPYAWLMRLPGFDTLRAPARFGMLLVLCLSAAGALAFARVALLTQTARARRAVLASLMTLVVADTWFAEMPYEEAPPVWDIRPDEIQGAALVLPLGNNEADVRAMYQGIGHGRPVVNGYSGNFPPWYYALMLALDSRDPEVLDELSRIGVTQIVVSDWYDREDEWHAYALTRAVLKREGTDGTYRLFDLPTAAPRPDPEDLGAPIAWAAITGTSKPDLLPLLADDDFRSRWDGGPQSGTESITIDLGATSDVSAVRMWLGPYGADFPRALTIEVSADGTQWTEAWAGPTVVMAFRSSVRNIARTPLVFDLGARTARFIRLRQTARDDVYYWSIAELEVLGRSAGAGPGAGR